MKISEALIEIESDLADARAELVRAQARVAGLTAERDALAKFTANECLESPPDLRHVTKDDAIVAVLEASDKPLQIDEIVKQLGLRGRPDESYNVVSVYLNTLLKRGRVQRVRRGFYTAVGGQEAVVLRHPLSR